MSKVITVTNHKGGVGKTTVSRELVDALRARGYSVGALDATAQGSFARFLDDVELDDRNVTSNIAMLQQEHEFVVVDTPAPSFDGKNFGQDTPTVAMLDAIEVADLVIIPTSSDAMDVATSADALETARSYGEGTMRILLNKIVPQRTNAVAQARADLAQVEAEVFDTVVHQATAIADACIERQGVVRYAAKSKSARQINALVDEVVAVLDTPQQAQVL